LIFNTFRHIFIHGEAYSHKFTRVERQVHCPICNKHLGVLVYEDVDEMTTYTTNVICLDCIKNIPMTIKINDCDEDIPQELLDEL